MYQKSFSGQENFPLSYGNAIYIHRKYLENIVSEGDFMVFGNKLTNWDYESPSPRNIQYLSLKVSSITINILNFHGV